MKYIPTNDDKIMNIIEWIGFFALFFGVFFGLEWFGIKLVVVLALFGISRIIMSVVNDYKIGKLNEEEAKKVLDFVKKMTESESKEK